MILPHYFVESLIRHRAQQMWEEEGRVEGKAQEHWERAENEIIEKIKKGEIQLPFEEQNHP